ncbi:liver carboxylesterase-like [Paramacrobiotus metropolitanus]|uniref:liver carboxylesterase-like n=1 Tax=Paramacrobiotus metropolitanus TaxID=2943436 RepID=UPI002446263B|nr:liver carboxylesterase-like [Paramacrobiotus metropolitanus]XP_055331020.1 liver carboxylesterase-like [Paramacrobiotus metropolitanus]XP_055331021.1 liver carboxylesterase-like [Paramacrobiotus metropolitanus]XP_055331022.1 liver carboxylesterase-like [Paramacrobiotus metropolitanus]XP_055331023.1 liver carboxylesterase-like [Paramacrobiotus metropolitanus]
MEKFSYRCIISWARCALLITGVSIVFPVYGQEGHVSLMPDVTLNGEYFASEKHPLSAGYAYYGIRYGTAKRFQEPEENMDFSYLRNESRFKQGPICPQLPIPAALRTLSSRDHAPMSEDCLYLDIYVPPVSTNSTRQHGQNDNFPVLVWFHGGALQAGDKNNYNASSLADNIAAIVVTVNYRVSVFGFLSTGDDIAKGNYGLADAKLAMLWIKKNIMKFGGDPDAITLFGESAGGRLISAMQLDPVSRSSMRAAIAFSGSILVESYFSPDPKKDAKELAAAVGCPTQSSAELIGCLKNMSVDKILSVAHGFKKGNPKLAPYGFVVDHVHFGEAARKALSTAMREVDSFPNYITGYLREDASLLLSVSNSDIVDPKQPINLTTIRSVVANQFLPNGNVPVCPNANYELAQTVMDYYNMTDGDDYSSLRFKIFHLATDAAFAVPAGKEALMRAQREDAASSASQLFRISHNPKFNDLGAFHTYDLPNIFAPHMQIPGLLLDDRVVSSIRQMLHQIAHFGRMDGLAFGRQGEYMELNQSGHWENGSFDHLSLIKFWDDVYNAPCSRSGT